MKKLCQFKHVTYMILNMSHKGNQPKEVGTITMTGEEIKS